MLPIRLRLTLTYSGLFFLALALSGTAVVSLLRQRLNHRLDESLDRRLQGVENFLVREVKAGGLQIPSELAEYASTQPEGRLIEVANSVGEVLLSSDSAPPAFRSRTHTFSLHGQMYFARASASVQSVNESVEEIRFLLLWSSPILLALIGWSGYWISSRSLRPVDEMTRAARNIGAHDLGARLPIPATGDELARLAEAWNEMLARLQLSFDAMHRFTADAAHELRTPLAALRTTAELSLRRSRTDVEYRQALQQTVEIADRMQALAETLLATARGTVPDAASPLDLGSLVNDLAAEMRPLFADKNLQFEVRTAPGVVQADANSIRRILVILLENAMRYTPAGGLVTLTLACHEADLQITVTDTGSGIPQAALPRVFDRFFRVDESRDRQTGGFGLGLAIARQIAEAHRGSLSAASQFGSGSTFTLHLPRCGSVGGNCKD